MGLSRGTGEKITLQGTSLLVRGLRIHLSKQGMQIQSLVVKLRPHILWSN